MTDETADRIARFDALATALGVAVPESHLAEAARGWALLAEHRARVMAVTLGREAEPAPVFWP